MSSYFGSSSPPISPHVAPRSTFASSFLPSSHPHPHPHAHSAHAHGHSPSRMAGGGLRPSRRDLLLVVLTLSLSYLAFGRGEGSQPVAAFSPSSLLSQRPISGKNSGNHPPNGGLPEYLDSWKSPLGSFSSIPAASKCPPGIQVLKHETFTESVETRGFDGVALAKAKGTSSSGDGGKSETTTAAAAPIDWDDMEDETVQEMMTVKLAHQPGWTLAEKFYLYNGSIYVVTYVHGPSSA